MHLSHVAIYLTAFITPTDASLIVRESSGMCLTLCLHRSPLWWGSYEHPEERWPSQDCSLVLTWLAWLLHTTALNSAWANWSQGEGNQIFLCNTSSLLQKHALRGVPARWICPAFPWKALPNAIPVGRCGNSTTQLVPLLPQVCKDRDYDRSQRAQAWPWRKMWQREQIWGNGSKGIGLAQSQPHAGHSLGFSRGCRSCRNMGLSGLGGWITWCSAEMSCVCLHWRICSGFLFYVSKRPVPFVNRGAE